jgi:hypothetical protein
MSVYHSYIEARQFVTGNGPELAEWCRGRFSASITNPGKAYIDIGEEPVAASKGDWIIKGETGQFCALPDRVFRIMFEREPEAQP